MSKEGMCIFLQDYREIPGAMPAVSCKLVNLSLQVTVDGKPIAIKGCREVKNGNATPFCEARRGAAASSSCNITPSSIRTNEITKRANPQFLGA